MLNKIQGNFQNITLNLLRIVSGFLLIPHGAQKLFGLFGGFGGKAGATAPFFSLMGPAGVLEFFGGLAILFGVFTRPVAFILSGEMAIAYFMAHIPMGFWSLLNHGELAALYSFIFLFLAAVGGGNLSIDELIKKKKG